MTATITLRDESAVATGNGYRYDRIVDIAGRIVRVSIERQFFHTHTVAFVDMINDHRSWTRVVEDLACAWFDSTPSPSTQLDVAAVLGPIADQLLRRAAAILAPEPTTTATVSPLLRDAVSALLATSYGYNGERRITVDDIAFATTYGGRLHVIEHDDGSVTFTKEHRDLCPLLTSSGSQPCDDECFFEHPADAQRRHGR